MKLSGRDIEAFVKRPPQDIAAVLVYGPNEGLVRQRAAELARSVVADLKDPFRVADLAAGEIRDDPARLGDEASALSMTGGKRVVFVSDAADALHKAAEAMLASPPSAGASPSLVILTGGDLSPRSSLRKLFEEAGRAAALPCYADDAASLSRFVESELAALGLICEGEARELLLSSLGEDREAARREIEKLALYMATGDGGQRRITTADIAATVGNASAFALDDVATSVASGLPAEADAALSRLFEAGELPISVLRAVSRHFERLHRAAAAVERGELPARAVAALKPPVFFKMRSRMEAELRLWPAARLGEAISRLAETEIECKGTGAPAEAIAARACLALAGAARRKQG